MVQGCHSEQLRRDFLKKTDLSYTDLLNIGRNHDNVEDQARQIEGKIEVKQEPVYHIRSNKHDNNKRSSSTKIIYQNQQPQQQHFLNRHQQQQQYSNRQQQQQQHQNKPINSAPQGTNCF